VCKEDQDMTLWQELLAAFCLVLILEGLTPFLIPRRWRCWVKMAAANSDRTVRLVGLASIVLGLTLLYVTH
tara:strand:- start:6132 stop:6344 length:213 start_codon:yes stop_codon:yes gene_type:complete